MPTLLLVKGLRFFFYSNENNEPAHVHVAKGSADGKVWLEPAIRIEYLYGFSNREEHEIMAIVTDNYSNFKIKWNEYFNK